MIEIDGSYQEGGGQILRTALALSVITQQPFHMSHIRENRPVVGLKKQHLTAIKALEKLCKARVTSYEVGTTSLTFEPGPFIPQKFNIDIGTAGSITLLLQSLLIPMTFAAGRTHLILTGGTDVAWSVPIDYLKHVLIPQLGSFAKIAVNVNFRGFFPKGGGEVEVIVETGGIRDKIELFEQGKLEKIEGVAFAANHLLKGRVAERMVEQATVQLKSLACPVEIKIEYCQSLSLGAGIVLWSLHNSNGRRGIIGADALGEKGLPAEKVASTAAYKLQQEILSGSAVDCHFADNVIPFLGLLGGTIKTSMISPHTKANIYVCETFLGPKYSVDEKSGTISVDKE